MKLAAGQGHAYAMDTLGNVHHSWMEHEQALEWFTKGVEAGLPRAMHHLGCYLDQGKSMAAPDYPAAEKWYRRAAEAGSGQAANNLCSMYTLGRGRAWQIISTPATSSSTCKSLVLSVKRHPLTRRTLTAGP